MLARIEAASFQLVDHDSSWSGMRRNDEVIVEQLSLTIVVYYVVKVLSIWKQKPSMGFGIRTS